ncbi:hypothetical protein Tco_0921090 [Tanacetum coccineum]
MSPWIVAGNKVYDKVDLRSNRRINRSSRHTAVAADTQPKRPLIEDLKVLWDRKGVETIDVASGQKFNMRAMVLWTINDFPARSSLSGWSGQGYKACPTCNEDTPSVRSFNQNSLFGPQKILKEAS